MIFEGAVVTIDAAGVPHVTPLGMTWEGECVRLAPFRPSRTLDNLEARGVATMNYVDDVRVFAGCLTGHRDFDLETIPGFPVPRLACALTVDCLEVAEVRSDPKRPAFLCHRKSSRSLAPFRGFNRAQGAVLEAAILFSRVTMLPREKMARELDYLGIAIGKTAGPREREAWDWLIAGFAEHGVYPTDDARGRAAGAPG